MVRKITEKKSLKRNLKKNHVENMETSSCDGEPPESISENKAIPCSILNDCKRIKCFVFCQRIIP